MSGLTDAERELLAVWDSGSYSCACPGTCPSLPCDNDRDDLTTTVERIIAGRTGAADPRGREERTMRTTPAGYFVAPDAFNDIWIWRERGEYPVPVVAYHDFRDDPELWDYLVSALPHEAAS